ncbi:MAG: OB-fold putative lipoprotein [Flavobacteriaceae bacterium]|nr:OB-fold putative lipoprotein [Flavobacteriaceae bacterium]
MKKKTTIIALVLLAGIIAAFAVYQYTFNSSHRDIASEAVSISISAQSIQQEFSSNEASASQNYLDKVVAITGVVSEITNETLILDDQVYVVMSQPLASQIEIGEEYAIKGRCIGYDGLLEMVKIDQATPLNKTN